MNPLSDRHQIWPAVQLTWVVYYNTERLITCLLTVANSSNRSNRERHEATSGVYNYCSR